jgi:glyoxylase-like metal-dependent hydrolase (beta-lactamase superfamily II)
MKLCAIRLKLSLWLLVLLSVVVMVNAQASDIWANTAYASIDVDMQLVQLSPQTYYVQGIAGEAVDNQGFISNAGVIITEQGVVVVDALGSPSLAYLLLSKIRALTDKPVVKVIATHYHADHIYGLQVFKAQGAEIIAPLGAAEYLASPTAESRLVERRDSLFPWVNDATQLVSPDVFIAPEDTLNNARDASEDKVVKAVSRKIQFGKMKFRLGALDFEISPLGSSHSQGDLTVKVVQEKVSFVGDLIFEGRIPFVAGAQPQRWIDNLAGLDVRQLKVIVPGHGPASYKPRTAVNFTLGYLQFLRKNMAQAVENLTPFDEAYAATDWSYYEKMPAAVVNRMNAYYVYLGLESASVAE